MMVSEAPTQSVVHVGFWSAVATAIFCILFTIAAALTEAGALPAPWDAVSPLAPSLALAPAFLVMLVCVNAIVPSERKIWSQLGVAFAEVYVPLCSTAYIVEMFVVEPRVMHGAASQVALLTLTRGDTILNAVDGLGYIFMCLATLFAAPAFVGDRLQQWIRWLFLANGILAVPIFLTYFVNRSFLYAAMPWSVTISGSAILLAIFFRRSGWSESKEVTDRSGYRSPDSKVSIK